MNASERRRRRVIIITAFALIEGAMIRAGQGQEVFDALKAVNDGVFL